MGDAVNVVVVGAGGTLGAYLVRRLNARAVEIRCPDERDTRLVPELSDADAVVNAGGPRVRPGLGWADYFREHVGVTGIVVRSMRRGARLVHLSSTSVYGARGGIIEADAPPSPTTFPSAPYACAKLAAENAARALGAARGLHVTVLRASLVYGEGIDSALESIRGLARRRGVSLRLAPSASRQHCLHVRLLARAVERAVAHDGSPSAPLNLADPFVLTNADLVPRRGVPLPIDLRAAGAASRVLARALGSAPPSLEALAVLAADQEYEVGPTWRALDIDAAEFSRAATFDRYWESAR